MIAAAGLPDFGHHEWGYGPLVGLHPKMRRVYGEIERVADATLPVVITGPTGSGKELVAQALHARSARPGRCFALNVHALPEPLAEAELFGFTRGAFTGATSSRRGLLATADKGTFILDEAGDLPPALQVKLLRFLESGRIRPVGADAEIEIDARLILCTQLPPADLVELGRWRPDFRFRVATWAIQLPALSERLTDLASLTRHILRRRRDPVEWQEVTDELAHHHWPGNVRELVGVLAAADLLASGTRLAASHIRAARTRTGTVLAAGSPVSAATWRRSLAQVTREHVEKVLRMTGHDTAAASAILGIGRSTLYRRIEHWGLNRET